MLHRNTLSDPRLYLSIQVFPKEIEIPDFYARLDFKDSMKSSEFMNYGTTWLSRTRIICNE
jgi:hypothetical protein